MLLSRRRFHRLLLLGTSYPFVLSEPRAFALLESYEDLLQPFEAQVRRVLTALQSIGEPLPSTELTALNLIFSERDASDAVERIQGILDRHVLLNVDINPESRVSMTRGSAKARLVEHGWKTFLVKVRNEAANTSSLRIRSPQAGPMGRPSGNDTEGVQDFTIGAVDAVEAGHRWIALNNWNKPPLQPTLSGLEIEYQILQIYSRDQGQREASLEAVAGAGEQDLGYRSTVAILFECIPSNEVRLRIHEESGSPTTASLLITDLLGRVYPAQGKRAFPDLWFQPQIYRRDGESIRLSSGRYSIEYGRGPEYLSKRISIDVQGQAPVSLTLPLERWVQPSRWNYYSGDSHIHAAGCSHYESPSEGVTPDVMRRQVEGQALDVGAVLTWAPGWHYQSQFFSGHVNHFDGSADANRALLRYDVEVSGFPSSHCGHLVLLRLAACNYPGASSISQWPSWNLPILKWAKAQKAITGYAHSGWGMVVDSTKLPNYLTPAFDNCGANECIVDVTHPGMIDFVSGCDTWPFVELNTWYHVLNCGFVLAFAGETDFPCITDKCVGGGRSYVKLEEPPSGDKGYSDWVTSGMKNGRSYLGDGRSHILDFSVQGSAAGATGDHVAIRGPSIVKVRAIVCARLEPQITHASSKIKNASPYDHPYWHLERSRIGGSRQVPVELVVNGQSVQRVEIEADGAARAVEFNAAIAQSSWIALRIYPSSHTNPIFIQVAGKPIRASKKSAEWCRRGVDVCWQQKSQRIRKPEIEEAKIAYDHARSTYDRIINESPE